MNLSYWERAVWFKEIDYAIVGSGIVGLSCALAIKERNPDAKVVVFERGMLPSGASTKNAGFACFGSVSELLADLDNHSEEEVIALVKKRVNGLRMLRNRLGDHNIGYERFGGYELFVKDEVELFEHCVSSLPRINNLLKEVFLEEKAIFSIKNDPFRFRTTQKQLIFNHFEGQLNTGKMMFALLQLANKNGIIVLNNAKIDSFSAKNNEISLILANYGEFSTKKLCIATNGFAKQLFKADVVPARAQVLITKPIKNLHLKGTFHLDRGYYYFRNVENRVLFGGGRNLDFKTEETTEEGITKLVQDDLYQKLKTIILPGIAFEIEDQWSGIMGVGGQKQPIVKQLQPNVFCGVRLGGMGVAIGSSVGQQLADLATNG